MCQLKKMNFLKKVKAKKKGIALFTVLVFIPIMLLLIGSIIKAIIAESEFLLREKRNEQAFYLSEAALDMAYYTFRNQNFGKYTHTNKNNSSKISSGDFYFIGIPDYDGFDQIDASSPSDEYYPFDGWIRWKWEVGDSHSSMCGSTYKEEFMFMIYPVTGDPATEGDFVIKVAGKLGYGQSTIKAITVRGERPNLLEYAIFDNADLSEFCRGKDQFIKGKVHANGDLFICPDGRTVKFEKDENGICSVTSGGSIIAANDAWGRKSNSDLRFIDDSTGADQKMTVNSGSLSLKYLVPGDPGYDPDNPYRVVPVDPQYAYDHNHPEWADTVPNNSKGALDLWDGNVKDAAIGGDNIAVPGFEAFTPGGYYDQKATTGGLRLDSAGADYWNNSTTIPAGVSSAITTSSFYNGNEGRMENVVVIDIKKLVNGPDGKPPSDPTDAHDMVWPPNGVIYADTPVQIVNGEKLGNPLTVVSPYNMYVKSDFNMNYPTQADYNIANKPTDPNYDPDYTCKLPAALCSTSRIFFQSGAWTNANNPNGSGTDPASDPKKTGYTNDVANVVEINAAMIDGVPTVDERAWSYSWGGEENEDYFVYKNAGVRDSRKDPGTNSDVWANVDDLLENWDTITLKKRGTIIHLQNTTMAEYDNSNVGPGVAAWINKVHYSPPTRDYGPDPDFATNAPPEFPRSGVYSSWQLVGAMDLTD